MPPGETNRAKNHLPWHEERVVVPNAQEGTATFEIREYAPSETEASTLAGEYEVEVAQVCSGTLGTSFGFGFFVYPRSHECDAVFTDQNAVDESLTHGFGPEGPGVAVLDTRGYFQDAISDYLLRISQMTETFGPFDTLEPPWLSGAHRGRIPHYVSCLATRFNDAMAPEEHVAPKQLLLLLWPNYGGHRDAEYLVSASALWGSGPIVDDNVTLQPEQRDTLLFAGSIRPPGVWHYSPQMEEDQKRLLLRATYRKLFAREHR